MKRAIEEMIAKRGRRIGGSFSISNTTVISGFKMTQISLQNMDTHLAQIMNKKKKTNEESIRFVLCKLNKNHFLLFPNNKSNC